jgi:hypothetical protein
MNSNERKLYYQQTIAKGENIVIGSLDDLGLSVQDIATIGEPQGLVVEALLPTAASIQGFVVKHQGHMIEVRRRVADDVEFAFLHECIVRAHIVKIPSAKVHQLIPSTVAMDWFAGYIVSTHVETKPLIPLPFVLYEGLFQSLWDLERSQLFATELSARTLGVTTTHVVMTDVTHLVPFDPLNDYNEQGLVFPASHMIERFEKQYLIEAWADLESSDSVSAVIENIKIEKAAMLIVYMNKLRYCQTHGASVTILAWMNGLLDEIKKYLAGPDELWQEYMTNRYRGYVKDLVDELDQPSITPLTIRKLDFLIQYAQNEEAKERYLKFKHEALLKPIVE